jgi:hypothetical protein
MSRTAGKLNLHAEKMHAGKLTAGAVSAGALQDLLHPHLHPKAEKKMLEGGFFPRLANILSFANKAYSAIDKGISIGTKGYKAYGQIKKGVDEMRKKKDEPMEVFPQEQMAYGLKTGGGLKSKRKLPEALRKRAEFIGKHMKNGKMTMKEASDLFKSQNK